MDSVTASEEKVSTRIIDALVEFGAEREALRPEASLEELDIDSLDLFELGQILHHEFSIDIEPHEFEDVTTLGEAQGVMLGHLK